ncbi:MAG: HisA/HisF-related TIM barrel protein [Fuerstiella sp.]
MQIIPVMDVLNGVVVRGIAGQRSAYRPVRSMLTESCDPSVILGIFEQEFGFRDCYLADLDAIERRQLNRCTLAELSRRDTRLIVDRGVRDDDDVVELLDLGVHQVVIALETLRSRDFAADLIDRFGAERLVLSLDLRDGRALTVNSDWTDRAPAEIAAELIQTGFRRVIVLDLSAVGMNAGTPTHSLCQSLRMSFPDVSVITGGGVRSISDLRQLQGAGVHGALIASALHDGRLTPDDVRRFARLPDSEASAPDRGR